MSSLPLLGEYLSGKQQHQKQQQEAYVMLEGITETAANAMVSVVRLTLLILIWVLLVKLRSPTSRKQQDNNYGDYSQLTSRNINNGDQAAATGPAKEEVEQVNQDDLSAPLAQQQYNKSNLYNNKQHQTFDFRYILKGLISRYKQHHHHRHLNQEGDILSNNISRQQNDNRQQVRRKISQPELASSLEARELQQRRGQLERRRRLSDTSLAHLKLPPGPMGLPFVGYLPFMGREIHLTLTSLAVRYGPIYQIFLGGIRVVVLNDAALVRQAFKQPVFSGRPNTQLTRILQGYGIVNSDGALWKEQRAFLHSALRKLGAKSLMSGSNGLEAKIQSQVKEFVSDLRVHADERKPCQVRPLVARAVSSVVGSIVMNLTYRKYEEKEKFDRLIELMQEGFQLVAIAMPLDFGSFFRFFPGVSYAYKKMKRNRAETSAFFQGVADEHRKYLSETFNLGTTTKPNSLHPRSCFTTSATSLGAATTTTTTATATATASNTTTATTTCDRRRAEEGKRGDEGERQATTSAGPLLQASNAATEVGEATADNLIGGSLPAASTEATLAPIASCAITETATIASDNVELEKIVARDLVDAYIVQQKKHEKDGKENYFSDQQLVQIMSDIFSAGLETVTSTIEWSILFLILNPKCQEQIQLEIDRVIGRDRPPQLDHLSQMPYTEATIYEVLRRSNVVALGNAHATLDDASIGGYKIPKGTQVLPNLYGINMNPKLWLEPDRFDPSRFLVNERAQKPDYFIPFSVGRRMCLGDVLAKMEVFLFLIGLLQKYDVSVADEDRECPPEVKGTISASSSPASFRVALTCRQQQQPQPHCQAQSAETSTVSRPES